MTDRYLQLLRLVREQFEKNEDAASAVGISKSRFGRALKGEQGHLNPEHCFAVARILNESPVTILREAGHDRFAQLVEQAFPQGRDRAEQDWLKLIESLEPRQRAALRALIGSNTRKRARKR